jgi:hypothetical protein
MTNRHMCCTCDYGEMLNMDELICQYESHDTCIISHPYYWSCLKWKEIEEIPLPKRVKAGFIRGNIGIDFGIDS